ncbi:MAG: ABC transporter permease subunit [Lachnospiraceae bacterium]|nr:ABC transporter permease subunit [Lachnospiraceae bacterium]
MTILKHELKQNKLSFIIWTVAIAFFMAACIFIYPEMKNEMDEASKLFSQMGFFSSAFGMDKINFGTIKGFYSVECGNILGIGGAFFAAITGITALMKEEKERTAEFLFTHPVSRKNVITEKLISVLLLIIMMNVIIFVLAISSMAAIGEKVFWTELILYHFAQLMMQLEIAGICFGISAFISRSGIGIGIGLTAGFYFLNILANISDKVDFLKYITPYGYTNGSDIINDKAIDVPCLVIGMILMIIGIIAAYAKYTKKDLKA